MMQRGITIDEIETALNEGWEAIDAKEGTEGKVFVFPFNDYWEGYNRIKLRGGNYERVYNC